MMFFNISSVAIDARSGCDFRADRGAADGCDRTRRLWQAALWKRLDGGGRSGASICH